MLLSCDTDWLEAAAAALLTPREQTLTSPRLWRGRNQRLGCNKLLWTAAGRSAYRAPFDAQVMHNHLRPSWCDGKLEVTPGSKGRRALPGPRLRGVCRIY